MAPFRTIANERWRLGYVPSSSLECVVDWALQRLSLAALLVNASLAVRCGPGLESGAVLRH